MPRRVVPRWTAGATCPTGIDRLPALMTISQPRTILANRKLKIIVQRPRVGGDEYRVISPAAPLRNGALYTGGHGEHRYDMYVDRADGHRIALLWLLAARSPRSLVYLPMRHTPPAPDVDTDMSDPVGAWHGTSKPLDLVLAPRSVQFPPSRWKAVRERITAWNAPRAPGTARLPAADLDQSIVDDGGRRSYDTAPDRSDPPDHWDTRSALLPAVCSETLFLTGNAEAFRKSVRPIVTVTRDGPPDAARSSIYLPGGCNYHFCRTIGTLRDPTDPFGAYIHIEFCPTWTRS
jgi:hypothetical protein